MISDDDLKRDLSIFLALQVTRTVSNRERSLLLIHGPVGAKREFYRRITPGLTDADFQVMLANTYSDPKTRGDQPDVRRRPKRARSMLVRAGMGGLPDRGTARHV